MRWREKTQMLCRQNIIAGTVEKSTVLFLSMEKRTDGQEGVLATCLTIDIQEYHAKYRRLRVFHQWDGRLLFGPPPCSLCALDVLGFSNSKLRALDTASIIPFELKVAPLTGVTSIDCEERISWITVDSALLKNCASSCWEITVIS